MRNQGSVLTVAVFALLLGVLGVRAEDAAQEAPAPKPSHGTGGATGTFKDAKIDVNGQERVYYLVVPPKLDPKKPCPLVMAFHGLGDSKDWMPWYSHLDKLAEDKQFIVAFLNGRARMWPLLPAMAKDDLAFFDTVYDRLQAKYNIDLNRVFVAGMSNGSYFSHVIATQRDDKLAGIICHSGGLGIVGAKGINVKHKYAVMIIHGEEDGIVDVSQGRQTRDAYQKAGHPVQYEEIPGLGHWWANKVQINDKIWKFISDHPRK